MQLALALVLLLLPPLAAAQTLAADKAALLAFKAGGDADDDLASWAATGTAEPCGNGWQSDNLGWRGVRCTDHSGRVTRVSFVNKPGLGGSVADLMALSALTHLELAGCSSVTGNVGGTAALGTIQWLSLADTAVVGYVDDLAPACGQLSWLNLGNTAVAGSVDSLGGCDELISINLEGSAVAGWVGGLTGLSRLATLNLQDTAVYGTISPLAALPQLTTLDLSGCSEISGNVALSSCAQLRTLDLSSTAVFGALALSSCTALTSLALSETDVSGSIEGLAGMCAQLWTLDLSATSVTGSVAALSACGQLRALDLSRPRSGLGVFGSVGSVTSCSALTSLHLSRTSVSGRVEALAALTSLESLGLHATAVAGNVTSLEALTQLTQLELQGTAVWGDVAGLRGLGGLGGGWASFSACFAHVCTEGGSRIDDASAAAGADDCACCSPPIAFARAEGSGSCELTAHCSGEWSACTAECEAAGLRVWTESISQSGAGRACPAALDCRPGEGACPQVSNCTGIWSPCTDACEPSAARVWTELTPRSGGGAPCEAASDCQPGDDDCALGDDSRAIWLAVAGVVSLGGFAAGGFFVWTARRRAAQVSVSRTMESSNFLKAYKDSQPPKSRTRLWAAVETLVRAHCTRSGIPWDYEGSQFLRHLREEAEENEKDAVPQAAQRMWTSPLRLRKLELCSIINHTVRADRAEGMAALAELTRAINMLCVTAGKKVGAPDTNLCYRGGGFDDSHRKFYRQGVKYRQPAFLATSFSKDVASIFLGRAGQGMAKVLWLIRIHPVKKCVHVNLVRRRVAGLGSEQEYLFAPYSVFTVKQATWRSGSKDDPHVIELLAAPDNKLEPEGLPLAPWS